jgi:hypothetical protein
VDHTTYIQKTFPDHLLDARTYQSLSPTEADIAITKLAGLLGSFLTLHHDDMS